MARHLTWMFVLLLSAPFAHAQSDEELLRELTALRKQLAEVELDMKILRAEVAVLREELTGSAGTIASNGGTTKPHIDVKVPTPPPPPPVKPDGPKVIKRYKNASDILRDMPTQLQPDTKGGWKSDTAARVKSWLAQSMKDQKFESKLKVSSIQIRPNPQGFKEDQPDWHITILFETLLLNYQGVAIHQKIGGTWPNPILLAGDEDFMRDTSKIRKGNEVTITGTITGVRLGPEVRNHRDITIQLNEYKIDPTPPRG